MPKLIATVFCCALLLAVGEAKKKPKLYDPMKPAVEASPFFRHCAAHFGQASKKYYKAFLAGYNKGLGCAANKAAFEAATILQSNYFEQSLASPAMASCSPAAIERFYDDAAVKMQAIEPLHDAYKNRSCVKKLADCYAGNAFAWACIERFLLLEIKQGTVEAAAVERLCCDAGWQAEEQEAAAAAGKDAGFVEKSIQKMQQALACLARQDQEVERQVLPLGSDKETEGLLSGLQPTFEDAISEQHKDRSCLGPFDVLRSASTQPKAEAAANGCFCAASLPAFFALCIFLAF